MGKSTGQLYFHYSSTARIRIKRENCLYCDEYPCVYRIKTEKLDFLIPRMAVQIGTEHVYIPLEIYRGALNKFYQSIKINNYE